MPLGEWGANKLLDHLFKNTAMSQLTDIYIGLLTNTSPITEVAAADYDRVVANGWTNAASAALSNDVEVSFAEAVASWGTVTGMAIYDAVSGGNLWAWGTLITPKLVPAGSVAKFPIGEIDWNMPIT